MDSKLFSLTNTIQGLRDRNNYKIDAIDKLQTSSPIAYHEKQGLIKQNETLLMVQELIEILLTGR